MKSALAESSITMDPALAREKVAEYLKSVRARHNAEDHAILQGYKALAKGHTIIDLPKCIRLGGVFEDSGLPKIAVATASHEFVWVARDADGWCSFRPCKNWDFNNRRRKDVFNMPDGTLPPMQYKDITIKLPARRTGNWNPWSGNWRTMVPHVPPGLRPAHSLDGYAVLFEVEEWAMDPSAPADPALLKHIGGDLYAVLATWDLSALEQSVLNGRLR